MKPLVSVIVPVYKVENCLLRCLNSLCEQSLKDIEIILVDDASPDQCGLICKEYASKDARFKVIHHFKNKGLSAARNSGIQVATADYLMFVDSDDWVHEDFCRMPYECATRHQADLVMFDYQPVNIQLPVCRRKKSLQFGELLSQNPENDAMIKGGYKSKTESLVLLQQCVGQMAWNKLYHKDLFNDISYPEGYLFEDLGTTYKTILKANRIYYLDVILYYYNRVRPGRITSIKTKKAEQDRLEMLLRNYRG